MEGGTLPPYIIHPFSMEYRMWLYLTCVAAAWTGEGLGSQTDVQRCLTHRAQLKSVRASKLCGCWPALRPDSPPCSCITVNSPWLRAGVYVPFAISFLQVPGP